MKERIAQLLDWFENHFNFLIEFLAFVGGLLCLLMSIVLFVILVVDQSADIDGVFSIIFLPGLIGFFGVMILFALRITRHMTKEK